MLIHSLWQLYGRNPGNNKQQQKNKTKKRNIEKISVHLDTMGHHTVLFLNDKNI